MTSNLFKRVKIDVISINMIGWLFEWIRIDFKFTIEKSNIQKEQQKLYYSEGTIKLAPSDVRYIAVV